MSDDERKHKTGAADDADEEETSGADPEEETSGADDEGANADGDGEEERSDEAPADDEADGGAAQRVAESLGVGVEGAEKADGDDEEAAAPANRAARRAEAAQRRKKRLAAAAPEGEEEAALPRDKNLRAKELLKRRREQATEARPVQLLPGEMVDDALARSTSAASKWIRDNFSIIQWVILAALAAGGGWAFYTSQVEKKAGAASDALVAGVMADRGQVKPEDKRPDDEKEADPTKVFKTSEERADTALASFRKVVADYPGTGTAILARLGEAGELLDKHDWAGALEAYSAVSSSSLAGADPDVKGRALEGIGFAKEGKGDIDGALATFKELEGVDVRGYKELGMYHQGRILLGKGDKEKAKELLKAVHDKLEQPTEGGSSKFLQQVTDDTLRRIDPSLVPAKPMIGGGPKGGAMSKEELDRAIKKMRESMEKKPEHHE